MFYIALEQLPNPIGNYCCVPNRTLGVADQYITSEEIRELQPIEERMSVSPSMFCLTWVYKAVELEGRHSVF